MANKIPQAVVPSIVVKVKSLLPPKAKLFWLSLTGSQAFGWANESYDWDIHGVFYLPGWFDYVHWGGSVVGFGLDLNLYNFDHVLKMSFYHPSFERLMNISNPFYIEDEWAWEKYLKEVVSRINRLFFYRSAVDNQVNWLRSYFHPRTALHTYRVILQPLYFAKFKKFGYDIFQVAEELGYKLAGLKICKEAYLGKRQMTEEEKALVWSEIRLLLQDYDRVFGNLAHAPSTNWQDRDYQQWYKYADVLVKRILDEFNRRYGFLETNFAGF